MCGTAMPHVNSEANTPPGAAGVMHLLADDHRVGPVAAPATDSVGQPRAEQSGLACLAVQLARKVARCVPTRRCWAELTFGEGRARSFEAVRVRGVSRCSSRKSSGMSTCRHAAIRPVPWPVGRTGPGRRRPVPRMPSMTKFTARRLGSRWRVTVRSAVSGSSSRSFSTVSVWASHRHWSCGAHPHTDVGVAALVAAACTGDRAERLPAGSAPTAAALAAQAAARVTALWSRWRRRCRCACHRRAQRRGALALRRRSPA